jgi:orotidine-5'-phosphate decarboxylase
MSMRPLIVALDVETDREAIQAVKRLKPYVDLFKVGPVLFLKYGGALLQALRDEGAEIFLDMKFHDIPSVVRVAIERAGEWGVHSATIHTSGGAAMMREAASAERRPRLWGVTVLTSLDQDDLSEIGIERQLANQVVHLARLAASSGLDGVIASVHETAAIRAACPATFEVVTPGIRVAKGRDDQKRTKTPSDAVKEGASFFVMGRPIIEAEDPVAMVQSIYQSIERPVQCE